MDLQLKGERVAVFGAARGIGRTIAEVFLAEGAAVAVLDRSPTIHEQPLGYEVDVTDWPAVSETAARLERDLGSIGHVVFAVGAGSGKVGFPFWNIHPTDWEGVLRVNLVGAVNVATAFGPRLAAAKTGSMTFLSSVAGQLGTQTDPPYSAAKAGLLAFVKCAARDLAPFGVRVNSICPGMVDTEMNQAVWQASCANLPEEERQSYEDWAEEKIRRVVPLGRWQKAEEVAATAAFLASIHGRNITGQAINVDGGFVMH